MTIRSKRTCPVYLTERIHARENVEIRPFHEVRQLIGDGHLERVVCEDTQTNTRSSIDARSLFSFIGVRPCTNWLPNEIVSDTKGYVLIGPAAAEAIEWADRSYDPLPLETSIPGVMASGDARSESIPRVAAAAGDGAFAVSCVWQHLAWKHQ